MRASFSVATMLVLVLSPGIATADAVEERRLSLVEATTMALALNHEIAIERETCRIAAASIDMARGAYDFSLFVDGAYTDQTDPVNSVLSGAPPGTFGPTQNGLSASASVFKRLPTGASLVLSTSAAYHDTNNFFVVLAPYYTTSVGLEFRQPLLEDLDIDPTRAAIRIAQIEKSRSEASLRRTVLETLTAVELAYWSLSAARSDIEVREASVLLARRQHLDSAARIETGDLPKSALAETTAAEERRKGELFAAQEAAARAENAFKGLILEGRDDPLWNQVLVPSDPLATTTEPVDLVAVLEQARTLRPELDDAQARIDRDAVEVEAARNRLRPRIDLVATYARRGLAGSTNPDAIFFPDQPPADVGSLQGGLAQSYESIGENLFPLASIGVSFGLPVGNRTARAEAVIADAQQRQSELALAQQVQRVEIEVRDAHAALRTAAQRIDAARAGLEAAQTQLRAEAEGFDVGSSTNFLVLTRQHELAVARMTQIAAMADYRKARIELGRASGTLLRERGIVFLDDAPTRDPAQERR